MLAWLIVPVLCVPVVVVEVRAPVMPPAEKQVRTWVA
jgi:hypothetical protein